MPGPGRLRLCDREEISLGLHADEACTVIAARLGKAPSTVSREVTGHGGRGEYRAWRAHQRARERARRPKVPKLACPRLAAQVTGSLEAWWPQEISARLRIEFAGDPMMQVSHETIYQALAAMRQATATLPGELFRTLTRDQGKEMAFHARFTIATGTPACFCGSQKPWQRGSNENTNGPLRQYLPTGTDLSAHTVEELDGIARSLSNRPRKTPGYMKPSEKLAGLIAHTG